MKTTLLAIALATATSSICVAQPKSVTAAQEWSAYTNEEPTIVTTPTYHTQQYSKHDTETKRLIDELKTIPVSEYKENYTRYARLAEYNPSVAKYADKAAFYKSKMDAQNEQEKSDAQKRKDSEWSYSTYMDKMTSKKVELAQVTSDNSFYFGFPYQGSQHAVLSLRKHPRHGKDIMLSIQQGQFMCSTYNNKVLVRFDDAKPQTFRCTEPDDQDSTVIFIRDSQYHRFVSQARKANKIRISASIYQEGEPVMEFSTKDLIFK